MFKKILLTALIWVCFVGVQAQTTEFTYQGSLKDGAAPANGNYDLEFALFDAVSAGTQLGSTLSRNNVAVANGIFSVNLDFGSEFPGATRFLEIRVRLSGQPGITTLAPRQQINSAPYSVRSLNSTSADAATNATQLGGVAANQYVVTTDPRMTDARPPTSGSADYIQNGTSQQSSSNFNITGTGTANIFSAGTQFNIGGDRVLSNDSFRGNVFAGNGAGVGNTTGAANSFFGNYAGNLNTTGYSNSFFGASAGLNNTSGYYNSFFGYQSGTNNTNGYSNAFYGSNAGLFNTTGDSNSFFGESAGRGNTEGVANSFFGASAGKANTTGNGNAFFGKVAGTNNTTGSLNSFFGIGAGAGNTIGSANSFFGASAGPANSGHNNSFVGYAAGYFNTIGGSNSFIGASSGFNNTTGNSNSFLGVSSGGGNTTGNNITLLGFGSDTADNLTNATAIGSRAVVGQNNSLVLGSINGFNGATANVKVGIGTASPSFSLQVVDPSNTGLRVQTNTTGGTVASFGGLGSFGIDAPGVANGRFSILENGNVGIGIANPAKKLHVVGEDIRVEGNTTGTLPRFSWNYTGGNADGKKWQNYASGDSMASFLNFTALNDAENAEQAWLRVVRFGPSISNIQFPNGNINITNGLSVFGLVGLGTLGGAGSTALCLNFAAQIATCSSSLRYKTNIGQFSQGLSFVQKLRPISFDWKDGGMKDVGFGAEDIAKIDPRFVTYNDKGEVEGVKYDRLSVAFVNAFKEQQEQIEKQQALIERLEKRLEQLEKEHRP